ncbi:hypothetical protein GFS24_21240 [Chitinophaga sp. SYP-B3965]|uniref:hypothetical protein n=1 Tax=Chitinophaga sp. SYP-B3965 TaxID=2663120 RepID=UPI00129985B9|nr:hypothetical protein [Chitinophaga sp. SYP-B3965]MRG47662.1 hypothetical protein [Chitinophaga sp. SYP-B3965]
MAKADNNVLLNGLTGSIGKQVTIKQRGGKTIVSKAQQPREKAATAKQQEAQDKFSEASAYAKGIIKDEEMTAMYRSMAQPGQNAYNLALKDAYNAPVIENLETGKYLGKPGDTIQVRATDDFRVFRVTVAIYSGKDVLLEKGNALMARNGKDWVYTATGETKGSKVIVTAEDLPGNETKQEIEIA